MSTIAALRASRAGPAATAAAAAAGCAVLAMRDPNQPGSYGICPFLAMTGRWCPGCGSLRALHALLGGDIASAIGLNVLAVAALPYLAFRWLRWALGRPTAAEPAWAIWSLLGVVLGFWALRNVPAFGFLAP